MPTDSPRGLGSTNPTPPPAALPQMIADALDMIREGRGDYIAEVEALVPVAEDLIDTHAALLAERDALREALKRCHVLVGKMDAWNDTRDEIQHLIDTTLARKEPARDE